MGSKRDSWPKATVRRLIELWNKGQSAARIGGILGTSKNAVHCKVARLRAEGVTLIEHDRNRRNLKGLKPARQITLRKDHSLSRPVASPPLLSREKGVRGPGVKFEDLQPHHCRWPIGDPLDKEFMFCGNHKAPSLPYCPGCASDAYPLMSPTQLEALFVATERLIRQRQHQE